MKIRFTPAGRVQFLAAVRHIKRENPSAARRFRDRAEKSLMRLKRWPLSGRPLPEFPDLPHREIVMAPYRFFYRIAGDTVWFVAFWHGAQLPAPPAE